MPKGRTITISYPDNKRWIPVLRAAAFEFTIQSGLPKRDADKTSLALEEALLHTNKLGFGGQSGEVSVCLTQTGGGVEISVRAQGLPLEEKHLPKFDPARLEKNGDTAGLSCHMIRQLVNKVTFSIKENGEREILLRQFLPLGEPDSEAPGLKPAPPKADKPLVEHPVTRIAGPGDAEAIARLALRSHGQVLFSEHIYYPAHIREMMEKGVLVSVVAETEDGEIFGHAAITAPEPDALNQELTYLFVNKDFKSPGCSMALSHAVIEAAIERNMQGVYAFAVTNHTRSQWAALNIGLRECCLFLSITPASRAWSNSEQNETERIANLVLVRHLQAPENRPLFVPEKHRHMIEKIYRNLELDKRMEISGQSIPDTPGRIKSLSDHSEGWALLEVEQNGHDTCAVILKQLRLFSSQGIQSIQVSLHLNCPATPAVSIELEKSGFFFAGVAADDFGQDIFLLQYLNTVEPDFNSIHVYSPFARELLKYVRTAYEHSRATAGESRQ